MYRGERIARGVYAANPSKNANAAKKGRTKATSAALRRRKRNRRPKQRLAKRNRRRVRAKRIAKAARLRRRRSEFFDCATKSAAKNAAEAREESAKVQRFAGARSVQARARSNPIGGIAGRM